MNKIGNLSPYFKRPYNGLFKASSGGGGRKPGANNIVYFPLEDDLNDYTGNHTLTTYNSAQIGTVGGVKCLDCTSSSAWASCSIPTLPQGGATRTEMCWVKWTVPGSGEQPIWSYGQGQFNKLDCALRDGGIFWTQYGNGIYPSPAYEPTIGDWYHYAITINGSTEQKLYINGVLVGTSSITVNTNGTNLYFSHQLRGSTYGRSCISKFIVESTIRTAQEIEDYYNQTKDQYQGGWQPGQGLVAYYPFDNDWNDHKADLGYSGTTYNCTLINAPDYEYTTAKVGNGRYNKTYSTTSNKGLDTGITMGNEYTIMFRGNIRQSNNNRRFFGTNKSSDGGYGLALGFVPYSGNISQSTPSIKVYQTHLETDVHFDNDTRHHYAIVQNGTSLKIYIDGTEYSYTVDQNAGQNTFMIAGNHRDFSSQVAIDELYVRSRAVSAQEIQDYYAKTS